MTVTGIAWYRADQYSRLLAVAVDAPDLEATYDEWKTSAERARTELESQGMVANKIDIDIEDLISWCQARGRPLNGDARAEYTAVKVREAHTMAFSEIETARIRKALDAFMEKRRPPAPIRPELDLGARISDHSVEIFEIRPVWRGKPGETREHPVAKATFVRSRGVWRVFWMRSDLKWHGYEPVPEVKSVEAFCTLVSEDAHACFFG